VIIPSLVMAPVVAFSYATVGAPYPATAAAKVEGGLLGWLGGIAYGTYLLHQAIVGFLFRYFW